jgi:hypothetical protein
LCTPEVKHITALEVYEKPVDGENTLEGCIEVAMYIGSIMRHSIRIGDQIVYLDESDPQYRGFFAEGHKVKLIMEKSIHLLKSGANE